MLYTEYHRAEDSNSYVKGESYAGSGFHVTYSKTADFGPAFTVLFFDDSEGVKTFDGLPLDHLKMLESVIHQARVDAEQDGQTYTFEENR